MLIFSLLFIGFRDSALILMLGNGN